MKQFAIKIILMWNKNLVSVFRRKNNLFAI